MKFGIGVEIEIVVQDAVETVAVIVSLKKSDS